MESSYSSPTDPKVAVIILPLPCQSHLNQLLHLGAAIVNRSLPVHYLGTATHNRQACHRYNATHSISLIKFHDLPTLPIPTPDPDPYNPCKIPMHLSAATSAYMSLSEPIASFVHEMASQAERVVVIYDRMLGETARDAILMPNVEGYAYNCLSGFNLFHILWEAAGKPFDVAGDLKNVPPMEELIPVAALEFIASRRIRERAGDIHNTIRMIDEKYINMFAREEISGNKPQWTLRPIVAVEKSNHPTVKKGSISSRHKCLEWLDAQQPGSVIYVSFGTTISLTEEEAGEIAAGIELSGQKFLWVLRDADKIDIFSSARTIGLPEGFEERVGDSGIVVRDWAPQVEILGHESTGGFMTHCGWNSCLESLVSGVAVAALPMHSDQPLNAVFLTEVLKVGIEVRDWWKIGELVTAEMVKTAVERLMASEEGLEVRRRAAELGDEIRAAEDGGEMERFICHICR